MENRCLSPILPNLPVKNLPWEVNAQWLDDAIARGDDIFLASPIEKANPGSYFAKELEYLRERGYEPVGAYMVKKR